jgi:hypothetical protein
MTKSTFFQRLALSKVDAEAGVISGVSIITVGAARGHQYWTETGPIPMVCDETTLQQVMDAITAFGADGVKVKADHWSGFDAIVGALKDPKMDGPQLRGDLHLLESDDSRARIIEMAQKMPSQFGLSISFSGIPEVRKVSTELGTETDVAVARVTELYSVDLVDDPAANPSGLFSAVDSQNNHRMPTLAELLPGMFGKDGTITELQTALAESRANLSAAQLEATNLKTKNSELTAELSKRDTALATAISERDEFKATIDKPDGEIEKRAGLKAREIVAKNFGQVPLEVDPSKPAEGGILAQWAAIQDPIARTMFYNDNKKAILLARQSKAQ